MNKRIVNGMVGVITSNSYGSGWAFSDGEFNPARAFCPALVDALTKMASYKDVREAFERSFPDSYESSPTPLTLTLTWIPQGTQFRVVNYDGVEGVILKDKDRDPYRYMTV